MERRALLGGMLSVAATPLVARGQPAGKPARLGILYAASPAFRPETDPDDRALVAGLRDQGYTVGQNVVIEFRSALWGTGTVDRIPPLAAELVGLGVDVLVVTVEHAVKAAQNASRTVPIVMAGAAVDPVASGFVASLARPGGNITGVTLGDVVGKRVELLRDALPGLRSVAALHADLTFPIVAQWLRATEAAAHRLGLAVHPVRLPVDRGQWDQVFDTVSQRRIGAVTIHENPGWQRDRQLLADLALKHRLPMVVTFRSQAEAGGLMSFAPDLEEIMRRAGNLAGRILRGAKPAELPVEEPTKYQLVLNLRTAKVLGLTIPPAVWARADELLE
jgi:putative ABC transport system substrate-binding protein